MLAEAMVARGFAAGGGATGPLPQVGMIAGIVLLLVGWLLRLLWGAPTLGAALLLVGIALVGLAIWRAGSSTPRTTYRPAPWGPREWIVALAALATALIFLLPLPVDRSSLFYTPYPVLTLPPWSALFGFATWGLLAPAFVLLLDDKIDIAA
jgi:energy-coupling factor transport system permease protein